MLYVLLLATWLTHTAITPPAVVAVAPLTIAKKAKKAKKARKLPRCPNLARINAAGETHGIVFASAIALERYVQDKDSVGDSLTVSELMNAGLAVLTPNGTKLDILSPRLQSVPGVSVQYARVLLLSGGSKGRTGYVLWSEVAALPKPKPLPRGKGKKG